MRVDDSFPVSIRVVQSENVGGSKTPVIGALNQVKIFDDPQTKFHSCVQIVSRGPEAAANSDVQSRRLIFGVGR